MRRGGAKTETCSYPVATTVLSDCTTCARQMGSKWDLRTPQTTPLSIPSHCKDYGMWLQAHRCTACSKCSTYGYQGRTRTAISPALSLNQPTLQGHPSP